MNWKQQIEVQIVVTDARGDYINQHSSIDSNMHYDNAETMRLLRDVAVAAEKQLEDAVTYVYNPETGHYDKPLHDEGLADSLCDALDKLRERR